MKKSICLLLALLMALSLCACGAGKASGSQSSSYSEAPAAAESAMMSYNAYGDSFAMEDALAGDYDTGLGAAAPVPKPEAQKDSSSGSETPEQNQDKIIYSSEVTVEEGAVLRNCVIMRRTHVGRGAQLDCVIADKNCRIAAGTELRGNAKLPLVVPKGSII